MENNRSYDQLETPLRSSKSTKKKKKKKKKKRLLFPILLLLLLCFFGYLYYSYQKYLTTIGSPEIYYSAPFTDEPKDWVMYDANWLDTYYAQEGTVKLERNEYFSPHMMTTDKLDAIPSDTFVYHIRTRMNSFTSSAITLTTLYFPTGPLTIVVNKDHQIGISNDFHAKPEYSNVSEIKKDTWEDIYVHVNGLNNEVTVFLDNEKILTVPWKGETFPLQEIWLGSIWVGNVADYGVSQDIAFDEIKIGNEALLPKPTFITYLISMFN
jgi:hypothetical protein